MRTLHLVVDGLADIVQQACALGGVNIRAQLGGHHARKVRDLDGVLQDVLAVTRAVMQAAEHLHKLGVQAADAGLQHGALALRLDDGVHLAAGLVDHLFNVRGMDAAVGDELFERQARNFAAHGLEARDGDRLGRVVDDEVDARERFDRADVAAFAADDAAFHLVIGQGHHTDGDLGNMVGSAALDGRGDDLAGAGIGLVLGALLQLLDLERGLVRHFALDLLDQVLLGVFGSKTGNTFEHFGLAALDDLDFFVFLVQSGMLLVEGLLALFQRVGLAVEVLLLLLEPALLLLLLGAAFLDFLLVFVSGAQDIFLCLQHDFAFLVFSALDRFVDNTKRLFIGVGDLLLGAFSGSLANPNTKKNANDERPHRDKRSVEIADHAIPPVCCFLIDAIDLSLGF